VPARGKVSLFALFFFAAIVVGGYWALIVFPVYIDNIWDVREALDVAYNQAGRRNDAFLKGAIQERVNSSALGVRDEVDESGNTTQVFGIGITEDQILITRNPIANTILIRVDYEREVRLIPSQRIHRIQFSPQKEGPILQ
jgi:hypothetical protein